MTLARMPGITTIRTPSHGAKITPQAINAPTGGEKLFPFHEK